MNKYIDINELGIGRADPKIFNNPEYANGWNSAIEIIEKASTADVVEVVRCKDCPYFRPYEEVEDFDGECIAHEIETDKTEFCSIGCKTKGKSMQEVLNEIY